MFRAATATIWVADHARAVAWYRDALGLELARHVAGEWAQFVLPDGFVLALHPANPNDGGMKPGGPSATQVGLEVDRPMANVLAELRARGVAVEGPVDSPPVRLAFLSDPDGNALYLYERIG